MNQLSLQVMTWGMVSSAVSTAVWLAMVGDAAALNGADAASRLAAQSKAAASPSIRPVVYHPALQSREGARSPVSLAPPPARVRKQS